MNKAELIEVLTERLEVDRAHASRVVEELIDAIVRAVHRGESVTITGFGVFERRNRAARVARNPRTGETVKVRPTSVPAFRPGAQFKQIVSGLTKLSAEGPAVKRGAVGGAVRKSTVVVKKAAKKAPAKKAAKKVVKKAAAKKVVKKAAAKKVAKKTVKKAAKRSVKKVAPKPVARKPAKKAAKRATKRTGATRQAAWNSIGSQPAAARPAPVAAEQKHAPKKFQRQYKTWLQRLIGLRRRLLGETTQLEEEALKAGENDVSIDHMADYGSDSYEQEFTLSLIESKSEALRDVDEAIRKIEVGTYGLCEECETLIPKARLEVLPHTQFCIECKSAQERASGF